MLSKLARSKPLASLALLLAGFVFLEGCGRFSVDSRPAKGQPGVEPLSVSLEVFQTHKDQRRHSSRDGVITSLMYQKNGRWQVVGRSAKGRWTQAGLVPGEYRVSVAGLLDEKGELQPIKGPRSRDFSLKDGEAAQTKVVVKRMSNAVKVLIAVTIIFVVILAILEIFDGDLDVNIVDFVEPLIAVPRLLITYPEIWLEVLASLPPPGPPRYAYDEVPQMDEDADSPDQPRIRGYGPAHEAQAVRPDADVRITFDRPMSAWTLSPNTIYVEGSSRGEIVRGVDYLEDEKTVVVDPLRDFEPGETVTVTVFGESIADTEGEVLGENYRFSFQVAPAAASPASPGD